jgi:hypothetical protein
MPHLEVVRASESIRQRIYALIRRLTVRRCCLPRWLRSGVARAPQNCHFMSKFLLISKEILNLHGAAYRIKCPIGNAWQP